MKPIIYNGYTIEPETEPWAIKYGYNFKFYAGIQDEGTKGAESIEDAKNQIDELCWESGLFLYTFETFTRGAYAINETFKAFGRNIDEAMENIEAMIGSKDYRLLSITK